MKIVRASDITVKVVDPAKWTGQVWQANVLTTAASGLRGDRFVCAPGHRSNWHNHEGEQALYVISGRGLVAWEGLETAEILEPGDWVHVSPGTPHWHGAVPDDTFVHLAITATGGTLWRDPVDDETYRRSLPTDDVRSALAPR
jgi:quercetin dioxygenase-like cupin family protein